MFSESTSVPVLVGKRNTKEYTTAQRSKPSQYTLNGRSRAGDATTLIIPELKWMFDCGTLIGGAKLPRTLFITHTHADHIQFLTRILLDTTGGNASQPPTVYIPEESLSYVKNYIHAFQQMINCHDIVADDNDQDLRLISSNLQPLKPNQDFYVANGGRQFRIHTLSMIHRIPCLGYSIYQIQKKLKPEYMGLSGHEIRELKKSGIEITTEEEIPFLCIMGDTTAQVFHTYPNIMKEHTTIVTECTFLYDDEMSYERSQKTKHTHWKDLQPMIALHPNTMFYLIHFSLKYSTLEIRNFFLQQGYDNIHPMLVETEIEREWIKTKKKDHEKVCEDDAPPKCQCWICRS